MSNALKKQMAVELGNNLKGTDSFVLFSYEKLKSHQAYELRRFLREKNVCMKVLKNSIASIVLSERYSKDLCKFLAGANAIAYSKESGGVVNAAKFLLEWNKKSNLLQIKAGYLPGRVLEQKEVEVISKLPSREVLLSSIAGLFQNPLQQMAGLLTAPVQNFNYAINGLMEQLSAVEKK